MDERLAAALAPVLRDARSTVGLAPEIVDESWSDVPGRLSALMRAPDATWGVGVMAGASAAERVVEAADAVQEWVVEQLWGLGRPATWPQCPEHPDTHQLAPRQREGIPVWACPRSGSVACRIGGLGS